MAQANTIAPVLATDQSVRPDRTVRDFVTEWSADFFAQAMAQTRRRFNNERVAEQFANMIACDGRTARRYLSGDRTPGGSETMRMLLDPQIGPSMLRHLLERAEQELSVTDYERFCVVMAEAVMRRFVKD